MRDVSRQRVAIERTRLGIPIFVHEESVGGFCHRDATVFRTLGITAGRRRRIRTPAWKCRTAVGPSFRERGTHAELLAAGGWYARLARLQQAAGEGDDA